MSIRPSVASGFIPEHRFEDACEELSGLALKSGQSESHLEYRQQVRLCNVCTNGESMVAVNLALVAFKGKL